LSYGRKCFGGKCLGKYTSRAANPDDNRLSRQKTCILTLVPGQAYS